MMQGDDIDGRSYLGFSYQTHAYQWPCAEYLLEVNGHSCQAAAMMHEESDLRGITIGYSFIHIPHVILSA